MGGLGEAAVDPSGRLVELEFGNPSWGGTGRQVLDVWLLDTRTARLTHVPGLPAFVHLKWTDVAWSDDGRLVLLVRSGNGHEVVVVWRPGEKRLSLKLVQQLPERDNTIALLR